MCLILNYVKMSTLQYHSGPLRGHASPVEDLCLKLWNISEIIKCECDEDYDFSMYIILSYIYI